MSQSKKYFTTATFIIITLIVSVTTIEARNSDNQNGIHGEKAVKNLCTAIRSENPGLRESGIDLACRNYVTAVSDALTEQLKVESDPNLRIMIVRVLYIIGGDRFMDNIHEVAVNDDNLKVRKMAAALHSAIEVEYSSNLADKES